MQRLRKLAALITATTATAALAASGPTPKDVSPEQLSFRYQRNVEPWESASCKHEKSPTGLFEWNVYCLLDGVVHRYGIHLAVQYYPRTIRGVGAYEVLYWVTDRTQPRSPAFTSTSVWVHNSSEENKARAFELGQGIENDLASLWLEINLD